MTARTPGAGLATAAVVALLLGGCVAIPTSGDVSSFDVERQAEGGAVPFLPNGPEAGASQAEIVEGFLRAGVGPQESYGVAREFLATDFAARWSPNEQVAVFEGAIAEPTPVDDDTMTTSVSSVATVDASGVYAASPQPVEQELSFDFVQEDGEWRIASAPNVVVLSRSNFGEIFRDYTLYFSDPSGDYLVPDLRWFPALPTSGGRSTTGERVVRSVLAGPVEWLAPGVVSAFGDDTQLPAEFLRIADGVATVDLPSQVLAESGAVKRRMLAQLSAALADVDGVTEVRLTVGRFPMQVPSGGDEPISDPAAAATPVGLRDGVFGQLGSNAVEPLDGLGTVVAGLSPVGAAVSRDRSAVAVLAADGEVFAVRAGSDPQAVDDRADLITPTIDPFGYVWSVPASDIAGMQASGADGEPHQVPIADAAGDERVVAAELSRDGTRMLMAVDTAAGPALQVRAVLRDADLMPVGLGGPLTVTVGVAGGLLDVAWVDSSTVAVLVSQETGPVVRSIAIGGRSAALGGVPGAVQLVGGNGVAGLRALDADGAVHLPTSTPNGTWPATGVSAAFLAAQQ